MITDLKDKLATYYKACAAPDFGACTINDLTPAFALRALCAELVQAWDKTLDYEDFGRAASYVVDRARATLAEEQQEPTVPQPVPVTERQPLWKVMYDAYWEASDEEAYQAMIEALTDWLVPEEPQPLVYPGDLDDHVAYGIWIGHMEIRQRLLDEVQQVREGQDVDIPFP